jgi:transcriptional regulator with XRE-family HTH domain
MRGSEMVALRKRLGYNQRELMIELDVKSRQTISAYENSLDKVPRLVELALVALESKPECRIRSGKKAEVTGGRVLSARQPPLAQVVSELHLDELSQGSSLRGTSPRSTPARLLRGR